MCITRITPIPGNDSTSFSAYLLSTYTLNPYLLPPSQSTDRQRPPKPKMLRRKPTAIAITSEDLLAFEERREAKKSRENNKSMSATGQQGHHARTSSAGGANLNVNVNNNANTTVDPSDELKPLPGDKARIVRSREERIGIGMGRRG